VGRIRVLVVDDSAVVRRMIRGALEADPELEVVAEAPNGREGILRIREHAPDAVVCDVEMPEMSGIETVQELRRHWPKLPVVMFASPNRESAHVTLEALHAGANDFVTKPSAAAGTAMAAVMEQLRNDLGGKLKALVHGPGDLSAVARAAVRYAPPPRDEAPAPVTPAPALPPAPAVPMTVAAPPVATPRPLPPRPAAAPRPVAAAPRPSGPRPVRSGRCEAVLIAVSTGGPNALAEVVPRLPRDLPVPVLIVQHMPPVFTRLLAERLAAKSALTVVEAAQGDEVRTGTVLLAPGDHHLTVRREGATVRCALNRDAAENSVRPAADVLLRSAAEVWGGNVLVVVMTGMGQDGLLGAMQLHNLGAPVLVQDEASSVVWGMPGAVAKAGIAEKLVPLSQLADAISSRVRGR
jgi:two-component system chemotaxis response regulator CheB